jgi:hypothetical protein
MLQSLKLLGVHRKHRKCFVAWPANETSWQGADTARTNPKTGVANADSLIYLLSAVVLMNCAPLT